MTNQGASPVNLGRIGRAHLLQCAESAAARIVTVFALPHVLCLTYIFLQWYKICVEHKTHNNNRKKQNEQRNTRSIARYGVAVFGDMHGGCCMSWKKPNSTYPDQRPGSSFCDDIDRRAERNERLFVGYVDEIPPAPKRESWRNKARREGIRAYSFDDYCEKLDARRDDDLMAQAMHDAERKLTDAQLAGVEELTDVGCTMCGRRGHPIEFVEHKRRCGDSRGEWSCASGFGCQK